jgi:hypothetical protein
MGEFYLLRVGSQMNICLGFCWKVGEELGMFAIR